MLLFGALTASLYILFAFTPLTYGTLLAAVLVLTASFLFVASAQNGLTSTLGQQHAMSGQISAVWNIFASIPTVAALLLGGGLSNMLEEMDTDQAVRILFLIGAAIMASIAAYALWRPSSVFDNVRDEGGKTHHPLDDVRSLVRHWPIYPALLIWFLWNFAPGSAASSVLSSEHTRRKRHSLGPVERDFCRLVHPNLHAIRPALPKASPEDPAAMGDGHRGPTDGAVALHPFSRRSIGRSGTYRAHGRHGHCRLYGPNYSVLSSRTARNDAYDGRRTQCNRGTIWRCIGY
jgi:MFS family permease